MYCVVYALTYSHSYTYTMIKQASKQASILTTGDKLFRMDSIREFVEVFENSSFTRPSGGAFVWILLNEKGVCGSYLEFQKCMFFVVYMKSINLIVEAIYLDPSAIL